MELRDWQDRQSRRNLSDDKIETPKKLLLGQNLFWEKSGNAVIDARLERLIKG